MAKTLQIRKELQANFIEPKRTQHARSFTGKYVYKEFIVTADNFRQLEWKKLVLAETEAIRYVLRMNNKVNSLRPNYTLD